MHRFLYSFICTYLILSVIKIIVLQNNETCNRQSSHGVLAWSSISVMKHYDQKQVGKEMVYLAYISISQFIIEGN